MATSSPIQEVKGPLRYDDFYFESVVFLVEDNLFKVPRYGFEQSEVFQEMFTLPTPETTQPDGLTDTQPLHLAGILIKDFIPLLRVMYPINPPTVPKLEKDEWVSVLKLATMWEINSLRNLAIMELEDLTKKKDPAFRLMLSRRYKVHQWFIPAASELVRRAAPIDYGEAEEIGFDVALKLAAIRERFLRVEGYNTRHLVPRGAIHYNYETTIQLDLSEECADILG
ncbi:hypothetical protein BDN72DRAFT_671661 [Pluteus cervinus]|uniref:Uncharacterized protein n=1 Tax=Pluteus cervinus TaxID=181527 RepID=A0ACD3B9S5_9AGAR|nr:hypothetical protein BDN72DRAFT_671661 [Pluteus cervinus]